MATSYSLYDQNIADFFTRLKLKKGWNGPFPPIRRTRWLYQGSLILSDAIMISWGFLIAYFIRFNSNFFLFDTDVVPSLFFYSAVVLVVVPLWLGIFTIFGLYKYDNLLGGLGEYIRSFNASTAGLLAVVVMAFLVVDFQIARGWLLLAWIINFILVVMARFILRRFVYAIRQRGYFLRPTLIIGDNEEALLLARSLSVQPTSGLNVLGLVGDQIPMGQRVIRDLYMLGTLDDLPRVVEQYGVQELILATSALSRETTLSIFQQYSFMEKKYIRLSSGLMEILNTGLYIKELAFTPLISVHQLRLNNAQRFAKTMLDWTLILLAMPILLPIFMILGIIVKLDSSGPVLYKRRVMGINGTRFDALKFRTMHTNGDEILAQHPELQEQLAKEHKLVDDPRITRVGRILRRLSLDELPQLINVLKGQMSIVGPRMISPQELKEYGQWGMNLLTVKPGITGLWQVSGRSDLSYEERIRLDMHYIRTYTLWLDLFIILRTFPAVFKSRGAY